MKTQTTRSGAALIVAFEGDVDLDTSRAAREALLTAVKESPLVVVDLSAVPYIDSSGIASLIEAFQKARAEKQTLVLAAVNDKALRALKLARLDKVFTIVDTLDEALATA
ncbi:MAG: STAS domain-containing protein [Magnetospiraceae bacterium]